MSTEELYAITKIDPWFLDNVKQIVEYRTPLTRAAAVENAGTLPADVLRDAKRRGFSDIRLAQLSDGQSEQQIRAARHAAGIVPVYKMVDTCGAEFQPIRRICTRRIEDEDESGVTTRQKKIMILGGGPNRIGQGIEFDYCCVHAAFALKEGLGFETIMVNCNPETVSTDYDTSDKLYFEPLTTRRRVGHRAPRAAAWRHRAVRWADAAQARGAVAAGGCTDPGHLARLDRPR